MCSTYVSTYMLQHHIATSICFFCSNLQKHCRHVLEVFAQVRLDCGAGCGRSDCAEKAKELGGNDGECGIIIMHVLIPSFTFIIIILHDNTPANIYILDILNNVKSKVGLDAKKYSCWCFTNIYFLDNIMILFKFSNKLLNY